MKCITGIWGWENEAGKHSHRWMTIGFLVNYDGFTPELMMLLGVLKKEKNTVDQIFVIFELFGPIVPWIIQFQENQL